MMLFSKPLFFFISFCFLLFAPNLAIRGDVKLPLIFGDHMVLQQGAKLPVWGWADPGEKVTVTFGAQTGVATAGADGTWRVNLPPIPADNVGHTLTITGKNSITYQDVLVGDVWIASGQSNMEYGIHKAQFSEAIAKANDPQLRLFFVPKTTSLNPQTNITLGPKTENPSSAAKWLLCTPDNLSRINGQGFAAVAYFFARDIRQAKAQPLGLIESCWGGTRAEAWTSLSGLQKDPVLDHYVKMQAKNVADAPELAKTYDERLAAHDAALKQWNEEVGKAYDQEHKQWTAAVAAAQAAGQPAPPEPKPSRPRPSDVHTPDGGNNGPANLFDAMISPLIPFAIKGAIWYQGEFNSGYDSGREYATLFPRMITDWREHWGQGDFPFIFVQLPNLGKPATDPTDAPGSWVWVRDSQFKTLSLPNTGMAVAIDIGDPYQLHPPDKIDVGHRLALAARHLAYREDLVFSGPLYDSMTVEGNQIRLNFKDCGSGLVPGTSPYQPAGAPTPPTPTKLTGFCIAGADQNFVWADAAINGNTVVVSSSRIDAPVAVRYDWAESPTGDLYNKEGLPAAPFRTDSWDK